MKPPSETPPEKQSEPKSEPKRKKSSVRHTRAIHRDRQKYPSIEAPPEQIEALIEEIVRPATLSQVAEYHRRGLRERILTLPIMAAFLLALIWRHLGSVREAVRILNKEGVFWIGPIPVSFQAATNRLRNVPADLFEGILFEGILFEGILFEGILFEGILFEGILFEGILFEGILHETLPQMQA